MKTQVLNFAVTAVQVLFAAAFFAALIAATIEIIRTQPLI